MAERTPPKHYIDRVHKLGKDMRAKNGDGQVIFTDHAISRLYNRRIAPWKALMVIDNPDRTLESEEGEQYEKLIKLIGQRRILVTITREKNDDQEVIVVINVAKRSRGKRKKK